MRAITRRTRLTGLLAGATALAILAAACSSAAGPGHPVAGAAQGLGDPYYPTDGNRGYDVAQLKAVRELCDVPLVASGGAGAPEHFVEVFNQAGVDAALAASVFHSGTIAIPDLKTTLAASGIEVRL